MWEVEFTDEFEEWWNTLDEQEQGAVHEKVTLLEQRGPTLPYPHSSDVKGSKHGGMRELRVQHQGQPYRVLYAFDPRRTALLLIGGKKTGDDRWYETMIPKADAVFDRHLAELREEQTDV
jgi:hypothetical protein